MGLKRVVEMCMNNTQTGGEEDPLNSQHPKLAVGAPTDTSWAPRAHEGRDIVRTGYPGRLPFTPCARGSGPRAHGAPCPWYTPCPRGTQRQPNAGN